MFRELPPTAGLPPRLGDLLALSGPDDFEGALAAFIGVPEVQLESSASAGLIVALDHLKTRSARRTVIIPGYTCPLIVVAARQAGCRVVACDTVAGGFDLDLDHLGRLIGPDTLCVMPTHYGGALTDVARIRTFVRNLSPEISVIEDAAQSFGARWDGDSVGMQGDIGIYSFGVGKGLTIFKGGGLVARDPDVRIGLREASRRLVRSSPAMDVRRSIELVAYHLVYNPLGLAFAYGAPRRHWLAKGKPERAIGDEPPSVIPVHRIGGYRRGVGVRALLRLAAHLTDIQQRRRTLAGILETAGRRLKPYLGSGEPSGTFLFAMTDTPAGLDAMLAKTWRTELGVTKLFMHAIGRYETLSGMLEPSPTPNAERLAATTLTITTTGFMTDADRAAIMTAASALAP